MVHNFDRKEMRMELIKGTKVKELYEIAIEASKRFECPLSEVWLQIKPSKVIASSRLWLTRESQGTHKDEITPITFDLK